MERDLSTRKTGFLPVQLSPKPGSNDEQQVEKSETDEAGTPDKRFKRVTNMLYECLAEGTFCQHRFTFGYRTYCSWLLNCHSSDPNRNPPCLDTGKEH